MIWLCTERAKRRSYLSDGDGSGHLTPKHGPLAREYFKLTEFEKIAEVSPVYLSLLV